MSINSAELVSLSLKNVLGESRGALACQSADMFADGLLDSFALLELASRLEISFDFAIPTEELQVENFSNCPSIIALCDRLLEA
jgi:acyl carrier protein